MFELDTIVSQVLHNCNISDSHHAGLYSVCGLALRLRDLYKWEKGLDPWVEKDSSEILDWIEGKEQQWGELAEKDFTDIKLLGDTYDPFDTRSINGVLAPQGFLYGAGYVHSLKPSFFLGTLEDIKEVDGHTVYTLGRELARDLLTIPALSQENCIVLRKESAELFLWDQIFFIRKSGEPALRFGLQHCGLTKQDSESLKRNLASISAAELETYIYHELGELKGTEFEPDIWRRIVATFPHTPIEVLARTIKDLLADTNEYGRLRHITDNRKTASLAFFVAFLHGLRKELFSELPEAFKEFARTRDWEVIEQAISSGYNTSKHYAEAMSGIYRAGEANGDMKWVESEINERLLEPLGIGIGRTDEK